MRIALLGTGLMGSALAERLLDLGCDLTVWNRTREKALPLAERGARVADSPEQAIAGSEIALSLLRDAAATRSVLEETGFAALAGRTFVQMATIGPSESLALADDVEAAGGEYLEAPVLGSTPHARQGKLMVLLGGTEDQLERWRELFEKMGEPTRIGPVGHGAAIKLALNQMIPNLIAAFALSLGMVRRLGVDREVFLGILRNSALYAPTYDGKLPKMLARDFTEPTFPAELMLKDVDLVRAECERLGLDATVAGAVREILRRTVASGHAGDDYSALYEIIDPAAS
ncbi:MAG TPA: NAD(P)-dependent oxidoreductase [Thermoanaerobaculia bacterium]|nr:NAD(P)-dependent oxidoreductase [Thermoanaerobaculia bacterium]